MNESGRQKGNETERDTETRKHREREREKEGDQEEGEICERHPFVCKFRNTWRQRSHANQPCVAI